MVKPIEKPAIKHRKMNDVRLVVGIGASAGGLEALQQFFLKLPANSNIAFVIVQHLSPDYKSLMAEILGKYTPMQVVQAEHLQEVAPNRVYLIPPKKNLTIKAGHLLLTDYDHRAINHPIDVFFTSLAEESCDRAVGIVLSGTGSDGTNGIKSIKEHGGIVMAQDPKSAKFDGMPRSVINTGLADFVLTPQGLAEELLNLANYHQTMLPQVSSESSDLEILNRIYAILKALSGIDFTYYKRNTVLRRIERRMVVTKSPDMESFAQLLEENSSEAELLIKDILIGVTRFFRDREHFEKLKQTALTSILSNGEANEPVRIWSAGCSTGEEAYSIAILLQELKEELGSKREIKIFATDIDTQAIEKASKGVFPESISEDVSPERLAKYFVEKNDQYHISKEIRKMIIFAPHNMFSDPPFGKLDLISCRNVLIYFQPVLQKAVFAIFHTALKNGGYLFLGKSETASEYSSVFKAVATSEKNLRALRNRQGGRPPASGFYTAQHPASSEGNRRKKQPKRRRAKNGRSVRTFPRTVPARFRGDRRQQRDHPLFRQQHGFCFHCAREGFLQPLLAHQCRPEAHRLDGREPLPHRTHVGNLHRRRRRHQHRTPPDRFFRAAHFGHGRSGRTDCRDLHRPRPEQCGRQA